MYKQALEALTVGGLEIFVLLFNQIVSWNSHRLLECSIVRLEQ